MITMTKRWSYVTLLAAGLNCACANTTGSSGAVTTDAVTSFADTGSNTGTDIKATGTDTGGTDTGSTGTDVPISGTAMTVSDLQNKSTGCDANKIVDTLPAVSLTGLVVVSPIRLSTSSKTGKVTEGLFAQQKGGGANSGIYLAEDKGGPLANLKIGDVFDTGGAVTEYYCMTELKPVTAIASGASELPVAITIDVATVGDAAGDAANRTYESTLISLENVVVSDPLSLGTDNKPHNIMVGKTAADKTVRIGSAFYVYMQAKDGTANYTAGQKLNIRGVMEFSYGLWQVTPIAVDIAK